MIYKYRDRPKTEFTENAKLAIDEIKSAELSVLVGRNNSGKSFLLKSLALELGKQASYLGPARYQNFNLLGYYTPNPEIDQKEQKYRQFVEQWRREQQNIDNSPLNLQQAIAELPNKQRDLLFDVVEKLLNTKLEPLLTEPNNDMSQKYISANGHNISFTSSGVRLITTLITSLLDTYYDFFLIDEPELGISPEAQGILADFIFDKEIRKSYFPHIKHLVLATHSTIFLDRLKISNNYSISKIGDMIDIKKTETISDFNNIHFFLLGNRLETLYLPSSIILTEGKCDQAYLAKILEVKFPLLQLSVINSGNDGRIKEWVNAASKIFTDLQKSPYRSRIIIVLDEIHGKGITEFLIKQGIPKENILIWSKNGIEYQYPKNILDKIFGEGDEINITDDIVSRNGVEYKKWELCEKVVSQIDRKTIFPDEVDQKLFNIISRVSGV
jgi:predicted ATP-dependent endonuclease of OLD family